MNSLLRMMGRPGLGLVIAVAVSTLTYGQTWTDTSATTPKNWNDNANWGGNPFPNAAGTVASLTNNFTANKEIDLNQTITVGQLFIEDIGNNPDACILLSPGTAGKLVFDNGASPALLQSRSVLTASNMITAPIEFGNALIVSNASNSCLFFTNSATLLKTVAASGTGTVALAGINTTVGLLSNAVGNTFYGVIADGTGAVTAVNKQDAGVWTLACSSNTYSGGTIINSGIVCAVNAANVAGTNTTLGAGPITLNGGTLSLRNSKGGTLWWGNSGYTITVNSNAAMTICAATTWINIGLDGGICVLGSLNLAATLTVTSRDPFNSGVIYGMVFLIGGTNASVLLANSTLNVENSMHYTGQADLEIDTTLKDNGGHYGLTKTGTGILRLVGTNAFSGGVTVSNGVVDVTSDAALGQGATTVATGSALSITKSNFNPSASITQASGSIERWRHALARLGTSNSAIAAYALPYGVNLQIGLDLNTLTNKTITLNGGTIEAWRLMDTDSTARRLGAGVSVVLGTNSCVGSTGLLLGYYLNNGPLSNLTFNGVIGETGGPRGLTKIGADTVVLNGVNTYSGGTTVTGGTLRVGSTGRLGLGTVLVKAANASTNTLQLDAAAAIVPKSEIDLTSVGSFYGRVNLNFNGTVTLSRLQFNGLSQAPGIWAASAGAGVDHVNSNFLAGTGALAVLPYGTALFWR